MSKKDDTNPGYRSLGLSLHTSVDSQLKQLAKECGVTKSAYVSDLIKNYGAAQKKKYLPET